jgi:SSS family solute:Na+ symporter
MCARILYPTLDTPSGISQAGALPALFGILGPILGGLLLAALSAVIMSTSDSALLGASTIITRDIYKGSLKHSRYLTFLCGILALGLSLALPQLIKMLEMVATVYCVSLFVPIILGLYWKRATTLGALSGMFSSALSGVVWRFFGLEEKTGLHMLNVSLPISFFFMLLFSLIKPFRPSQEKGA